MDIQKSQNGNISTIEGNGFALYISPDNQVLVKDSNGKVALLSDLLGALSSDQDNIANFIRVSPFDSNFIDGFGSIEQRICAQINSLGITKQPTTCQYLVLFDNNPSATSGNLVTGFATSADAIETDPCTNPDLSPYENVLYHDGENEYPQVGDQVFIDYRRSEPYVSPVGGCRQDANGGYLVTDASGFVQEIICP